MAVVGLFYGSDTGNTENIAKMIQKQLGNDLIDIRDICPKVAKKILKHTISYFSVFRLGITVKHKLTGMIFSQRQKKSILQINSQVFSAVAIKKTMLIISVMLSAPCVTSQNRTAQSLWVTGQLGYTFEASKALLEDGTFIGLCIDEDRQPELTAERVEKWCKQIYDEMCLAELA